MKKIVRTEEVGRLMLEKERLPRPAPEKGQPPLRTAEKRKKELCGRSQKRKALGVKGGNQNSATASRGESTSALRGWVCFSIRKESSSGPGRDSAKRSLQKDPPKKKGGVRPHRPEKIRKKRRLFSSHVQKEKERGGGKLGGDGLFPIERSHKNHST